MIEEKGLHYHLKYRYEGMYKNGLEEGVWTITKTIRETIEPIDVLVSTMNFKKGLQDGELKIYDEEGETICLVVYEEGEQVDNLGEIVNVEEITRVLEDLSNNYVAIWKTNNIDDDENYCKGEGYLK